MLMINKWGNSQGIRIPKKYLDQLGLKVGDKVELKVEDNRLVIIPTKNKRKPKLDIYKLFKEENKENKEFNWGKTGKEVW
ncbi:AbrB/MazE/SpoVT family DNA-binding domain-containing protein [Persephonella sp.]